MEMAHVVLETDANASVAQSLARDVENLATAMLAMVVPRNRASRGLEVVALRDDELASFHPTVLGFFDDRRYVGPILVVGAPSGAVGRQVLRRELARAVVATHFPQVPQWLGEGLVSNLQTVEIDRSTAIATWGAITRAEIDEWRAGKVSAHALAQQSWPPHESRQRVLASKVLVRMLARCHHAQWACLVEGLSRFDKYEDVLDHCFPSRDDWETEYSGEVGAGEGVIGEAPVQVTDSELAMVPMSRADSDAAVALAIDGIRRSLPADDQRQANLSSAFTARLGSALASDPANVRANLLKWMSMTSAQEATFDEQAYGRLSAQLVAAHPEDWRAWCWRADLVSTPPGEVRAALAKASALAPDRAEVVELLAYDAIRQDRWEEAAQFALRAFTLRPSDEIAWNLVFATLEWQGRCQEARAFLATSSEIDRWVRDNLRGHAGTQNRPHHCIEP
jgi:hypothetical protein